jgi:rare lipoprotein A
LLTSSCGSHPVVEPGDSAPASPVNVSSVPDAVPQPEPRSRYGNPASYVVHGQRYHVLETAAGYVEQGIASWYGTKFHGRRTSSGEPYDMYAMTAAHKTLPLPTYARVTNLRNGQAVVVKINDRGPFHPNRIIDLSYAAATRLGIVGEGTGLVEVRALDGGKHPEPVLVEQTPPREPATATAPRMYIQVGAFTERRNAERLRYQLTVTPVTEIHIQQAVQNDAPVYRVRIGPMATVEEADRIVETLASLGVMNSHIIVD